MKTLITLFALVLSLETYAQSCPSDMAGISTTDHPTLKVGGRNQRGHSIDGVGDPNTDSDNWLNGIYNTFAVDGGSANFYYDTVIYNQTGPFITSNTRTTELGACNENGQCVQVEVSVSFSEFRVWAPIAGMIRRVPFGTVIPTTIQDQAQLGQRHLRRSQQWPTQQELYRQRTRCLAR